MTWLEGKFIIVQDRLVTTVKGVPMSQNRGTKLRAWRERERLSLEEVAALTGFTSAMLSFVERGRRNLSTRGKVLVARRLGVPLRELFDAEPVAEEELDVEKSQL